MKINELNATKEDVLEQSCPIPDEIEDERLAELHREFEETLAFIVKYREEEERRKDEEFKKKFEHYNNLPTIDTTPESVNRFMTNYIENHEVNENLLFPDYTPEE